MWYLLQLTSVIFLLVFSSCKQKTDYSKEITRLDSSLAILHETEKGFLLIDTGAIRSTYESTKDKIKSISEKISNDTVKKDLAILLSDAHEHVGNIVNLLENKKHLERALSEGQQRINNLKHDLQKDLIEKNKSAEYVINEINASQKISDAVNKAIDKAKKSTVKLDSLKTQIYFFADSITSK